MLAATRAGRRKDEADYGGERGAAATAAQQPLISVPKVNGRRVRL